jgi:4-alpha-glucanotransferase
MDFSFEQRRAGILIPSFAIAHEKDLGIGDTEGVRQMIDWCAKNKISVLQLLPINETGEDNSPYNTISSRALCPTTLFFSPAKVPGLSRSIYTSIVTSDVLNSIRSGPVNYSKVKALKRHLLWEAFQKFRKKSLLDEFIEENKNWLENYCLFRLSMELNGNSIVWEKWPPGFATPETVKEKIETSAEKIEWSKRLQFYAFVQWVAHLQWKETKAYAEARRVYLMGDMPYGVSRYSADVWGNREIFNLDWSGGAPAEVAFQPDPFTARWGQNWGIPIYRWDVIKEQGYRWWHDRVKGISQNFHLCRIDHVLGFYRIYSFPWLPEKNDEFLYLNEHEVRDRVGNLPHFIPGPDSDPHWHYWNRVNGETILKELQQAAGAMGLVAEDLGTVPDYVPQSLESLGIPGMKLPYFHRKPDNTYLEGSDYPFLSIATLGTHDNYPIAAQWEVWTDHRQQGLDSARWEQTCLLKWAGLPETPIPDELTPDLHAAICRTLFRSNSWLACLQISDWFATKQRFNVPGLALAGNWSERLPLTVNRLSTNAHYAALTERLRVHLAASGRGGE